MKKYEEYQESHDPRLGSIPAKWQLTALKRVTEFKYGDALQGETRDDEGNVNVYGSNGIVGKHNSAITQAPCIIIGRKGSYGKVNYSTEPCFPIDTAYFVDQTVTGHEIRFIYYLLQTCELDTNSRDSAVPGLSREEAYNKKVGLPPLPEQRAIAAYLDHKTAQLDTLLAQKETLLQKLHQKRQALINEAVTQGLDPTAPRKPSGVAWLGDVPAHWGVTQLKHVTDFINGAPFKPENWVDEGIPIVRIQNLNGNANFNCIDPQTEVKESCHLHGGELLFSWSGNVGTSFGPFMWERKGLSYLNQHIFKLNNYQLHQKYFYWLLKAVTKYIESKTHGIIGMVHVTKPELGAVPIPKISFQEQEAIANYLDHKMGQLDDVSKAIHTQIKTLKAYRQSLISEVVTGKVDVRPTVPAPEADLPLWQQ